MTNIQALSSITSFTANLNLLEKTLIDLKIEKDDTYSSKNDIDYASALVCKIILKSPDFGEGSLNVKYDRKELKNYANAIFERLNKQDEKIITNQINFI